MATAFPAAVAACLAIASTHYNVAPQRLEAAVETAQARPSPARVGLAGIPAQWLPYLQHYGFDAARVQTDPCDNLAAAAWIIAYTDALNKTVAAYAAPIVPSAKAAAWQPIINWVAQQAGMDPALINAVIEQESGYNPNAKSPAGAVGMMQIMPFNAKAWKIDPRNPVQNIWAGTWHLKYLIQKYDGNVPLALAAYNAGSRAVAKYGGIPPFPETRNYVPSVLRRYIVLASRRQFDQP
jgi:soluble lytic murein transglycosylase-like protein